MSTDLHITINDRALSVEKGLTILQAARQNDIYIPTLCAYEDLPSHGSCRMCIVEIAGRANTPTACTTPVEEGMAIQTESRKVQALRADLLKMLLSEHPASCLFCPEKDHCDECMVTLRKAGVTTGCRSCSKDAQCELQQLVQRLGVTRADYAVRYRMLPSEKSDPFFDRDYNLCVLCGRCVRVCEELHFSNVLAFTQRGGESLVGTAFGRTHLEAGCMFCGACVEACPSGALSEKTRKWDGKPDTETLSTCPLCGLACSLRILSKDGTVIGSFPDHAHGTGTLCVNGRFGITELVNHPTRLKRPQQVAGAQLLAISWEETIRQAAEKLAACGAGRFEMRVAPGSSSEDQYVAARFAREVMHTQSAPVEAAWEQTEPLDILTQADLIVSVGVDISVRGPSSVVEMELHRAQKRGARLVSLQTDVGGLNHYAHVAREVQAGKELAEVPALAWAAELMELLQQAVTPVIITGEGWMPASQELAQAIGARVVALSPSGVLRWGTQFGASHAVDVLYLVGEDLPALDGQAAFVVYQNIYPPSTHPAQGLILPCAAFTEQDGTRLDAAGRVHAMRKAVEPPGEALPGWEILCRIARAMGAAGFGYSSAAEIRAEMEQADNACEPALAETSGATQYLGFPLSKWVEGLQAFEGSAHV